MSALDAAVTLGKASGWSLTNLEMQKLLYLAQMDYMGEHEGAPLFGDEFQAWNLGPVVPTVYAQAKTYGRNPVRSLFHHGELPEGDKRDTVLDIYGRLKTASAWDLVSITHWKGGAWYKNFTPGKMFTPIPKADILDEYRARLAVAA